MLKAIRRIRNASRDALGLTPVLIGHSHSKVIFDAAERQQFHLKGFNFWTAPQPALNAERTAFHPEIARELSRGPVFSAVGGGAHNMLGMVRHPRPFDFVLPDRTDLPLDPAAELIPFTAVRSSLVAMLEEYLQLIALVRASATGPVFHIETPPPPEDSARMLPDIPWLFFPDLTRQVSPPALRFKCWRLHADLVGAFCAREGVQVIPPPSDALDAEGYLSPGCYGDSMHVNEAYGALVLRQIRQVL